MKLPITFCLVMCSTLLVGQTSPRPQTPVAKTPQTTRESISVGSVPVYLGEARTETLAALASAGYRLIPMSSGDQFSVHWQPCPGRSEPCYIGQVGFAAGRLALVDKDWTPNLNESNLNESSDYTFAEAIYYASQSLNAQGCESVLLSTGSVDQPAGLSRAVELYCSGSNRTLRIDMVEFRKDLFAGRERGVVKGQKSVSISVILQVPK